MPPPILSAPSKASATSKRAAVSGINCINPCAPALLTASACPALSTAITANANAGESSYKLLDAEAKTGISLTDSYAMWPAASVSGLYFAHPGARYFSVDRVTKDQVESYAARSGKDIETIVRWLAPNLGY